MSDASDIFGYIGGGAGIVSGGFFVLKALAGRVVAREDEDKKYMQTRMEKHDLATTSLEKTLVGFQHDMSGLRASMDLVSRQVEARATAQDKEMTELRSDMKEQILQLETRLRSDMQRLVSVPKGRGRT